MKKITIMAAAFSAFAGQAYAEIEFVRGSVSITDISAAAEGFALISGDATAAFSLDDWGFEVGATFVFSLDSGLSDAMVSLDGHFYRNILNNSKIGVYVNALDVFGDTAFYDAGAEAMFSFGAIDIEASAGIFAVSNNPIEIGTFDVTVYYEIFSNVEIDAGYAAIYQIGGTGYIDIVSAGIGYKFSDSGIVAHVGYQSFDQGGIEIITFGLSWNYGPQKNSRSLDHGSVFYTSIGGFGA